MLLTLFLVIERRDPTSKWLDYLELLPKDYTNFPFFYTKEEVAMLRGTQFLDEIYNERKLVKRMFDYLH